MSTNADGALDPGGVVDDILVADGVPVRVRVSGSGPPLLLIGGLGAAMASWASLEPWLAGRRVVRFDAPGAGASPTPRRPLPLRRVARVAAAALTAVGVSETDVLGMSMGGAVAQELARLVPQRVRRLVLVSTTCGLGGVPLHPATALALACVGRFRDADTYRRLAPRLIGGRTAADPDALRVYLASRVAQPPDRRGYLMQLLAASVWTSLPWLHRVRQPALVLVGDADPIVSVWTARLMAIRLPAARLHVVHGGGHLVLLDSPEVAMPAVLRFLGSDVNGG